MRLPYSTRSRFFAALERALPRGLKKLPREIKVALGPGGYGYDVEVDIASDDADAFQTNWESRQPSRFPTRVRAAATVLQRQGYSGGFRIFLRDGLMVIWPL